MDLYDVIYTGDQNFIEKKCEEFGISINSLDIPDYMKEMKVKDLSVTGVTNAYIENMMEQIIDNNRDDLTEEEIEILQDSIFLNSIDSHFMVSDNDMEKLSPLAKEIIENFG